MHSGFSTINHGYREELMVEEMFDLYHLLNATPSLVIELIQKPELTNMEKTEYTITLITCCHLLVTYSRMINFWYLGTNKLDL